MTLRYINLLLTLTSYRSTDQAVWIAAAEAEVAVVTSDPESLSSVCHRQPM